MKQETLYENYDNLIPKCIPNYRKILQTVVDNMDDCAGEVLDIGIGTGNLEEFIFKKFPRARVIGIDTSAEFLNISKKKYGDKQLQTIRADIKNFKINKNKFDFILSSLTIHHFEDSEKKKLFLNIYKTLKNGGSFINFDMVDPETTGQLIQLQDELFRGWGRLGLTAKFIEKEKIEMTKRDRLVKLSKQKEWLEKIGFSFEVIYQSGLFCAYICKK